jgi:hypothetical protein
MIRAAPAGRHKRGQTPNCLILFACRPVAAAVDTALKDRYE